MTIDNVQTQKAETPEKPPVTVQNEVEKEVVQQPMNGDSESSQKQVLQVLGSVQPQQQIQETAKNQIERGYLDVKA